MLPFTDTKLIRSAFVLAPNHTTAIRVEVRTLSVGHALVVATQPLEGERMLLKLDTERDGEFLLECDVPHRSEYSRVGWGDGEDTYSACRLRFRRALPISQVHESLLAAFRFAEHTDTAEFDAEVQREEEETLVPVLSAIGMAVVYASQTPWGQIL
jgi:hypothetical protein